jgi:TPR repeat protein
MARWLPCSIVLFIMMLWVGGCGGSTVVTCAFGAADECKSACKRGEHGRSCAILGAMYEEGSGVDQDLKVAVEHYLNSCLLGDSMGCHLAGLKYTLGIGVQPNNAQASRSFDAACKLGNGDGCAMFGLLRSAGGEDALAATYFKRSCQLQSPLGCGYLGESYVSGRGVPQNSKWGVTFLEQACKLRNLDACARRQSLMDRSEVPEPPAPRAPQQAPATTSAPAGSELPPAPAPPPR